MHSNSIPRLITRLRKLDLRRSQGIHLAISTLFIGVSSFAIIFVGARLLNVNSYGTFLAYWTALQTITLAFIGPYDLLYPRNYPILTRRGFSDKEHLLNVFKIGISTGLLSILTLLAYFALNPSEDLRLLLAFTAGAMFITVFNALRICLTASGQTRTVIALSSFATLMTILSLVIAGGIFKLTGVSLISSFFIGLVLSTSLIVLSLRRRAVKRQNLNTKLSAKKDTVQGNFVEFFTLEYLHVLFITFILLLLVNFPVMVAPLLSVEPEFLIEWFSIAVLVRIPLAILNSFTPPILNKVASLQLIKNGLATKILMEKSFQIYFLISICIVLSMAVMGPFVVGLLTDSKYEPSVSMCLLIASIEALVALFGLLRAFLVAIGGEIKLIKFLLFGLVLYLFILLTPINPELRLFLAPIVVTSFLMLVASREVLRRLMTIKE